MAKTIFMTIFWITVLIIITLGLLNYQNGEITTPKDQTKLDRILCSMKPGHC
jgi:uncharacterized membrane protein